MSMRVNDSLISGVVREVEGRILNNFMDLLILVSLNGHGGQISGYDVIKYLQLKYHFLPSPGTVYSCLYDMERKGLLRGKQNGRKRIYALTQHGAETAKAIINGKDRILNFMSMILQKNGSKVPLQLLPSTLFSSMESHAEP
jgi:DNA-binding PadR family transcriptional regulator